MATEVRKGQKIDITKGKPQIQKLQVEVGWQADKQIELDTAVFLAGSNGKVAGDDDFVFYGNNHHKSGSVELVENGKFKVNLPNIPANVEKLDFTLTIYDADTRRQNFGQVRGAYVKVIDEATNSELLQYNLGDTMTIETAIVAAEIYRYKGEWKFNAIGAGFSGGLEALCNNFGIDVSESQSSTPQNTQTQPTSTSTPTPTPTSIPNPASTSTPSPTPPIQQPAQPTPPPINASQPQSSTQQRKPFKFEPPSASTSSTNSQSVSNSASTQNTTSTSQPISLKKIELKKGQKVSLVKSGKTLGEIVINLNWSQPTSSQKKSSGFLSRIFGSSSSNGIDLDLACLYELQNGSKGVVQALGNCFGNLNNPPYIALDGDDRTGSNAKGETIRVNGKFVDQIKRILIFTFIYDGVANWREADGVVTVKCPGSPDIEVRMDEYGSDLPNCGIALLENQGGTFSVEKIVKFYESTRYLDKDLTFLIMQMKS